MIVAWTFIKLFAKGAFSFVAKHWRIILPLLILWYCYAQYNKQVVRADEAEKALATQIKFHQDFEEEIRLKTAERMAEDAMKSALAKKALMDSEKQSKTVIAKLNLDRERETKNLKDLYENRIGSIKSNFNQRLRLQQTKLEAIGGGDGVSIPSTNTRGLAERGRDCNGASSSLECQYIELQEAYVSLEKGCQITTSDYNRLRGWGNVACKQVGCK